ncbi:hypothetical protein AVEN_97663-1 [Araneus ventricosus]|uniref:Helitron helicase-like domain-containing protein n=1 Tax=Araneus ventricosus TaxID=182803 RepID=A0A4Y2GZP9_ARAVE|nr:hypothetical protein AVEN_97663-1 [Araneus ventricosus]
MAMVRKFGLPDLLVAFTCNPSWPEILNTVEGRERPENRYDIVVTVFKITLSEIMDDLIKRKVYGCVTSYRISETGLTSLSHFTNIGFFFKNSYQRRHR